MAGFLLPLNRYSPSEISSYNRFAFHCEKHLLVLSKYFLLTDQPDFPFFTNTTHKNLRLLFTLLIVGSFLSLPINAQPADLPNLPGAAALAQVSSANFANMPAAQRARALRSLAIAVAAGEVTADDAMAAATSAGGDAVAELSQGVVQAATEAAAAAPGATAESVAAAARTASTTVVQAAVTATANAGGDVAAAASAASAGATTGATSANTGTVTVTATAIASAAASGSTTGAVTGARASGQSPAVVQAVANSSTQGATNSAAAAGADSTVVAIQAGNSASEAAAAEIETPAGETTVTGPVEDVVVEVEAPENPSDNIVQVDFTTFTLALSYGNFTVTINSGDDQVIVLNSGATTIGQVISSNGGTITELDLSGITVEVNGTNQRLNGGQLANLDANLTPLATAANNGTVIVEVPSDTITVSPSS